MRPWGSARGREVMAESPGSRDDSPDVRSSSATPSGTAPYGIAPSGYRLPGATRLGQVRLQVADLVRSRAYYTRVLGMREIARGVGTVSLGALGDETPLVTLHERSGARAVPRSGRLGLYHFAVLLPDRASLGRFIRHLATIGVRPGMADHAVSEALYLTDPDGLGIEVYADRPREQWRHESKQLVMTTLPLDTPDLLRAAGDTTWNGLPAGTRIGHVHLHVGDLASAEAFYHGALGMDKMVWDFPGALFLAAGGYHHHLGTNTWAVGAEPAGVDDARLLEWEIVLPDLDAVAAALESLATRGYVVVRTPEGGVARDPWGTVVRVRAG